MMSSVTAPNFYRRSLPGSCVDFASPQGRQLFQEALLEGNATIYFKLAAQFRTQDEPAYCGLSTLVMILNALEVDPGRVWKAPWRFYHETMLDCCVSLEHVKKTGINLAQFCCLAMCNRLETRVQHAEEGTEFLTSLRRDVIRSVQSENSVLVGSYDRLQLGQTGSGHFSPIAAFHSSSDRVLILDVARFKYPPHWVRLSDLQTAMCSVDSSTKRTRGYCVLRLQQNSRPLVMFGLKTSVSVLHDLEFSNNVSNWKEFLLQNTLEDPTEELNLCCIRFSQCFSPYALCCTHKHLQEEVEKTRNESSEELQEACRLVCSEVRKTRVAAVFSSSAVAALMLAWPFQPEYSERSDRLLEMCRRELSVFSLDTRNEIALLNTQMLTLIACSKEMMARRDSQKSRSSITNTNSSIDSSSTEERNGCSQGLQACCGGVQAQVWTVKKPRLMSHRQESIDDVML